MAHLARYTTPLYVMAFGDESFEEQPIELIHSTPEMRITFNLTRDQAEQLVAALGDMLEFLDESQQAREMSAAHAEREV